MRLATLMLLATVAVTPAFAQTVSPMTGTTATAPTATAPAATAPATTAPARPHRMTMQQRFDAANTTHDGKLTLDQAKAAKMTRVAANFDAIDAGKKGYVTTDDIRAYNRAQRAAHRAAKPAAQ